jgi:SAM-dependent methyltransferase
MSHDFSQGKRVADCYAAAGTARQFTGRSNMDANENSKSPSGRDKIINAQQEHWESTFSQKPDMFGLEPSEPAVKAVELFEREGKRKILELGSGQGRDTLFFARRGFQLTAADYSQAAVDTIVSKAQSSGVGDRIVAVHQDVRERLQFPDEYFDACYSHMLFCMALTTTELEHLSREIWRVLRPGGLNVYTVRHTGDAHCGTGIHRREDMWEVGGFIVHFFNREKVTHLAKGFEIVSIDEFEEGRLPRRLLQVTLRKET